MTDPVQQIKDRLNIVEVIGQYVKLTKAGRSYKGLSPFKKERTPSFHVSPDKGMYYDFSSGKGGDLFTFIQEMEGVDFKGALKILADRAGVELKRESKGSRDARERMYGALDEASLFFESVLRERADALTYLHERGLDDATIRGFRLGLAPEGWDVLTLHLTKAGYRLAELETAGLAKRGEKGKHYDRFRSRIMFPIMDSAGRVIAFSGRIFGDAAQDEKNAKYLNSPETPLFDKGKILYGYDKAKHFIRKYDFAILVEGQMDLVMSHQAGYGNTVASSGTALSDDHLALIDRLTKKIVFAFDADSAGVASTGRAAILALARGMDVKVAHIPHGKDPADCIREDAAAWKQAVKEARHVVEFFLDRALHVPPSGKDDARGRVTRVRDTVLPYIARIASATDQAHFVRTVADSLGIAEDAVWQDVRTIRRSQDRDVTGYTGQRQGGQPAPKSTRTRKDDLERSLAGFLFWQEMREPRVLEDEHIAQRAVAFGVQLSSVVARYAHDRERLSFEMEISHEGSTDPHELLDTLLASIGREYMLEERQRISGELRAAERSGEDARAAELLTEFNELAQRIEALDRKP
jgi:DNA primase